MFLNFCFILLNDEAIYWVSPMSICWVGCSIYYIKLHREPFMQETVASSGKLLDITALAFYAPIWTMPVIHTVKTNPWGTITTCISLLPWSPGAQVRPYVYRCTFIIVIQTGFSRMQNVVGLSTSSHNFAQVTNTIMHGSITTWTLVGPGGDIKA